jgi:hypothetical protein
LHSGNLLDRLDEGLHIFRDVEVSYDGPDCTEEKGSYRAMSLRGATPPPVVATPQICHNLAHHLIHPATDYCWPGKGGSSMVQVN